MHWHPSRAVSPAVASCQTHPSDHMAWHRKHLVTISSWIDARKRSHDFQQHVFAAGDLPRNFKQHLFSYTMRSNQPHSCLDNKRKNASRLHPNLQTCIIPSSSGQWYAHANMQDMGATVLSVAKNSLQDRGASYSTTIRLGSVGRRMQQMRAQAQTCIMFAESHIERAFAQNGNMASILFLLECSHKFERHAGHGSDKM